MSRIPLFPLPFLWPLLITAVANEWPGHSVAKKVELLDAVFPREAVIAVAKTCSAYAEERVAQLEEAKQQQQNAASTLHASQPNTHHSAELARMVKAKAAEQFYTHMREQYNAEGEERILQEYVSPFADCAADCAQLLQNFAQAQHELITLHAEEQKIQNHQQHHDGKLSDDALLAEADMELEALHVAMHSVQLALQRLEERLERKTDWLMPSSYSTIKTLGTFSLRNAMAAEMEKRNARPGFCFWKPKSSGRAAEEGEKWENIPLK